MRAFLIIALAAVPAAALAAAGDDPSSERRVCTRVELHGGSRISYQRVCKTPAEWRNQLGPDWRQVLAGRSPSDGLETLEALNRDTLETPGASASDSFGRPGGGESGPLGAAPRAPR